MLKDFQVDLVSWGLRKGRAALFADCGLGKTLMQLSWADVVAWKTEKPVLIVTPLAVADQTFDEGVKFDIPAVYCRSQEEADKADCDLIITNYEMLDAFDAHRFGGVVLDESSIIKAFDGKTTQKIIEKFSWVDYRLACTATPAPNDHVELGNHAEFLGVMSRTAMLSRFFVHDSYDTSEWRLKKHAEEDFWDWVCSWAACITKPSDLGYSDEGYELPPLQFLEHTVKDPEFNGEALSATKLHQSLKRTLEPRVQHAVELILAEPEESWAVWCNTNAESEALAEALEGSVEVFGSLKPSEKAKRIAKFSNDEARIIVTKPKICGFGMNWQHCCRHAFVGLSYSYEQLYQAIRRSWRFGQTREVIAHLITADSEVGVIDNIKKKQEEHKKMQERMTSAMRADHGAPDADKYNKGNTGKVVDGEGWTIANGDCVEALKMLEIPDGSIDYSIFSPPFASLYTYTDLPQDMGNCAGDQEFFAHFEYLVPELYRVLRPGRLLSFHCMDLPMTKERDGVIGLKDFPGDLLRAFTKHGFVFHSRVTIWKDPLLAMQRTKAIGLLHKQLCKDSAMSRQGIADYVITVRKPGKNDSPVTHGSGFDRYVGQCDPPEAMQTDDPKTNKFGHEVWQRYASPVWFDINPTDVLPYKGARDSKDERHICPLQLQVIERCIELWSNPDDVVLSPFAGIGSEGYVAVKNGRSFLGIELKESYFNQAILNLQDAEKLAPVELELVVNDNPEVATDAPEPELAIAA